MKGLLMRYLSMQRLLIDGRCHDNRNEVSVNWDGVTLTGGEGGTTHRKREYGIHKVF